MDYTEEIGKMIESSTKLAAVEALVTSIDIAWMKKLVQMRPASVTPLFSQEHSDFLAGRMQLAIFYAEQLAELKARYPIAAKQEERKP